MWIVLIVLIVLVGGGILLYNSLVGLRIRVDNAWADVDVQLKRRYELIPNLVETVKGYAEGVLTGALRQLFALAESYPQLRAVESFTSLQASLQEIEHAIQNARRYYNAVVRDYNTRTQQIPGSLIAGPLGFQPRQFFMIEDEGEREAPRVSFDDED